MEGSVLPDQARGESGAVAGDFDAHAYRADFPVLGETMHGKPLVFLDTAASAQKPQAVIDAVNGAYGSGYANIHRGIYKLSQDATDAYEAARDAVRELLNAAEREEIVFVRGATEGINLVAQSWGRTFLAPGDQIVLTEIEHHSNIVPWQLLRDQIGVEIKVAPVDDSGQVDLDAFTALLGPKTKLVAMPHVSNSIGTVLPVETMIALAHDAGAKVLIDGCQAVPHQPVDVRALDADFYVFSAHKLYGPTGIGALYAKRALLEAMPPYHGGGDMIATVTFEKTTWNDLPYKFEAGTPHIAGGIGFKAAIDYVQAIGLDRIEAHVDALRRYGEQRLAGINSIRQIGTAEARAGILSFVMEGTHPHDVGTILDRAGVAVRCGHHCAQPTMDRFGVPGTVRASFGLYNTEQDVDALVDGLAKVAEIFG
ncbi:cysteine desulfurase/selenocysteine lyase [Rhodothalassium salexigens DSM 2132]|uniref:Cysteine desulfurase n=1 Tax=Rhodothalassium salexigens DSM 2132 TaxID=1188247 RepID=A0A4R2PPU0_RHOSA|nr:cysteine desulfurase [Rhodothalassium salexigens]MBB4211133.1 cysteine desulfurase/selenocysteine lyase [Rhodothalassium salexigens DSM 2132]MBK1637474.1 cysteine desulfurase CsdA [Rhodothalassium salexigens DSM 2132]TCP36211.1 cysteine desulfurase/selenocysteine lyase [Rhodothalassium salexigens DSM 2132]